jgi:hypothetical protein
MTSTVRSPEQLRATGTEVVVRSVLRASGNAALEQVRNPSLASILCCFSRFNATAAWT